MTLVKFSPPPGINSDDSSFAAEGRWADGNNVRFTPKPETIGGWQGKYTLAAGVSCIGMFVHASAAGVAYIMNGMSDGKLYRHFHAAATTSDVSPTGVTNPLDWSFGAWGAEILASIYSSDATGGGLFYQTGTTAAALVTQAPARIVCMVASSKRRQVLALGCNEELSGTFNPLCIRHCDFENYTTWTSTSSNNAGEFILPTAGEIIGGAEIGEDIAVWTNQELWHGRFIGSPDETYRWSRVDKNCGLVGPRMKAIHNGMAYWLTTDFRFVRWAPGRPVETLPCQILNDFRENFNNAARFTAFAIPVPKYNEVWFHYLDLRDTNGVRPSRYVAINLDLGVWFQGQMSRSAAVERGATALAPFLPTFFGSYFSADGLQIYTQEYRNTANSSAMTWHITSADQVLDPNRSMMVRGIIPDFEAQDGNISLTVMVRERPLAAATVKGPYTLTAGSTTKKDFRASGKFVSVKFAGAGSTVNTIRFGTHLFDVVPTGSR